MPSPAHSRRVDTRSSVTICATSAASSTGQSPRSGTVRPAAASTAAGPTECQASPMASRMRLGCRSPLRYSGRLRSTIAAATTRRHRSHRQQEQHRHEDELRGDREAVADREAHARHERIGAEQGDGEQRVEVALGRDQGRHGACRDEERGGAHRLYGQLTAGGPLGVGPVEPLVKLLHGRGEPGSEVLENPHNAVSLIGRKLRRRNGRLLDGRTFPPCVDGCP